MDLQIFADEKERGKNGCEAKSDTAKIEALQKRVSDLEQLLGKKQFQIEFMEKQFDILKDQYGVDLKKKASGKRSSGTGKIDNNTDTQ